ncbi:MAG: hypothetical protein R3251_02605 [Candidatus Spechtbacterales bacterium]|nr:hypothetical protein [Candidatus Spechtbacterales bacterium]
MSSKQGEDFYPVDNFFDNEDFTEKSLSGDTIENILRNILETYFMLPKLNVDEAVRVGKVDIVGCMSSVILRPDLSIEHKNTHLLEIYRPENRENTTDDFIASLAFLPPEEQERSVVFDIFSNAVKKEFREFYPDPDQRPKNVVEKIIRETQKEIEASEQEILPDIGEEFEQILNLSGMDFVSERTGLRVQAVVGQYKSHIAKHSKTPS